MRKVLPQVRAELLFLKEAQDQYTKDIDRIAQKARTSVNDPAFIAEASEAMSNFTAVTEKITTVTKRMLAELDHQKSEDDRSS